MYVNPFHISLETLLGVSPMLGHRLEDRAGVRAAQERSLVRGWQRASTARLRNAAQRDFFCVAPLDIMVSEQDGAKQFHVLELNGTGIGGLTNLSGEAVSCVLDGLACMARALPGADPVVLVAVSGKESAQTPRLNKLMHEKVLYAEALKRGFDESGRGAAVCTFPHLLQQRFHHGRPTIVLGYIKELLEGLELDACGRLMLAGRPVTAAVNDRFCLNVLQRFHHRVDMEHFLPMNRCFLAGADKGTAYALVNEFLAQSYHRAFAATDFVQCHDRASLIDTVLRWVRAGKPAVIKPQGTGLGHGIEFFMDMAEDSHNIVARIDASLQQTEQFYGIAGGALPYTVCSYIDACTIRKPDHALAGHRFELRVVVYRDGMQLKAFPSIAKVSSEAFDRRQPTHQSLINNITASAEATKADGVEFMLPLANRETLDLLDLNVDHLGAVCSFATGWVRHILDRVQDAPEHFGLPPHRRLALALPAFAMPARVA